jgi:hypothetical protein
LITASNNALSRNQAYQHLFNWAFACGTEHFSQFEVSKFKMQALYAVLILVVGSGY